MKTYDVKASTEPTIQDMRKAIMECATLGKRFDQSELTAHGVVSCISLPHAVLSMARCNGKTEDEFIVMLAYFLMAEAQKAQDKLINDLMISPNPFALYQVKP